jgi:hypothetical protein
MRRLWLLCDRGCGETMAAADEGDDARPADASGAAPPPALAAAAAAARERLARRWLTGIGCACAYGDCPS